MAQVPFVPQGMHTVIPALTISGAAEAIEFYKNAFGAQEVCRMTMPDSDKVGHAEIRIGDSVIMMSDEFPNWGAVGPKSLGGSPVTVMIYVPDVDATVAKAVEQGATVTMPVADMFWGDRYGKLTDPFGHKWAVATHIKDLTPEECAAAAAEAMKSGACGSAEAAPAEAEVAAV